MAKDLNQGILDVFNDGKAELVQSESGVKKHFKGLDMGTVIKKLVGEFEALKTEVKRINWVGFGQKMLNLEELFSELNKMQKLQEKEPKKD